MESGHTYPVAESGCVSVAGNDFRHRASARFCIAAFELAGWGGDTSLQTAFLPPFCRTSASTAICVRRPLRMDPQR